MRPAAVSAHAEHPLVHTCRVGIQDRRPLAEGEAAHGVGCVAADARKGPQRIRLARHLSAMATDDELRRLMEIPRPGIVPEAIPGLAHRRGPGSRKTCNRGISCKKARVELLDALDLRLLEHDFRHQHMVRVLRKPPREVATKTSVPGKKTASERRPSCRRGNRSHHAIERRASNAWNSGMLSVCHGC
jgi:hypothetical protein